jgi:hypothetical protein
MSNTASERKSVEFSLTWTQKLLYMIVPFALSALIILYNTLFTGIIGTIVFLVLGALLGLATFFLSAGWGYKLEIAPKEVKILDRRQTIVVPTDRIGMVVRNGGFPFPTLWLVLRASSVGIEVPEKGVDAHTRELIEAYRRRNPGKEVTIVPVPGGYLRSVSGFARELKNRIPPLAVDDRLLKS